MISAIYTVQFRLSDVKLVFNVNNHPLMLYMHGGKNVISKKIIMNKL